MKKGYLIVRFQTIELTDIHHKILNDFLNEDLDYYGIILCNSPIKATKNNPLDFESRRKMIEESYPQLFEYFYINDEQDNFNWSKKLDEIVETPSKFSKNTYKKSSIVIIEKVILYGSKDGFISKYFGKYETKEISTDKISELNNLMYTSKYSTCSKDWRAGALWSITNKYPTAYHTVDCAIFTDLTFEKCWMAKKPNESKLRFVGGFVDPNDESAEASARREAREETNLLCNVLGYISSRKIDDWRYRKEQDKIITTFYALVQQNGDPVPSDDISELYKIDILNIDEENVQPEHRILLKDVQNWIKTKQIFKEPKL